jgi:hypothetical protein
MGMSKWKFNWEGRHIEMKFCNRCYGNGTLEMEFCNRGYGNRKFEMEFCNRSYVNGNIKMDFCKGVAMENLKWNSVIGAIAMEILK